MSENSPSHTNSKSKRKHADISIERASIGKIHVDKTLLDKIVAFAKSNRRRSLCAGERMDILLLHAYLRYEHEEKKKKMGSTRRIAAPKVSETIAKIFRRKVCLVKDVWKEYIMNNTVTTKIVAANRNEKQSVVPNCRYVTNVIQEFIRERRETRTRTVAKDVLEYLVARGIMRVDMSNKSSLKAGLRAVQRFLTRRGYKRGKKKGNNYSYRLKESIMVKRDEYVLRMSEEYEKKERRIVYMDESYIHQNYCRYDDSLYDPNDEQDLITIPNYKGRRYCFIAAIVDADYTISEELRNSHQQAHLMLDTLDIFEGGKKQTKDYHGMFNHEYFVQWMEKLIQALKVRNINNAIIVMDNAKYHKKLPDTTPRKNSTKENLILACQQYGIEFRAGDTKFLLWNRLQEYIQTNVQPVIVKLAKDAGHEVMFSPPHYSDLQPIETVWAIVKGIVGRQYSVTTTFKDVLIRLQDSFNNLQSHSVQGCIDKANQNLRKLKQHIIAIETMNEKEDDDEECSASDSSSNTLSDDSDSCPDQN